MMYRGGKVGTTRAGDEHAFDLKGKDEMWRALDEFNINDKKWMTE